MQEAKREISSSETKDVDYEELLSFSQDIPGCKHDRRIMGSGVPSSHFWCNMFSILAWLRLTPTELLVFYGQNRLTCFDRRHGAATGLRLVSKTGPGSESELSPGLKLEPGPEPEPDSGSHWVWSGALSVPVW